MFLTRSLLVPLVLRFFLLPFSDFTLVFTPPFYIHGHIMSMPSLKRRTVGLRSTTSRGDAPACVGPIKGPSQMWSVLGVREELQGLSFSWWRKVGLPLEVWQESCPNFRWLPKVSEVATNHWVFLRYDWSPISSWFYYQS